MFQIIIIFLLQSEKSEASLYLNKLLRLEVAHVDPSY